MFVNPHPHWTIAYFQFFELQIISFPPFYESSLEWFPDSVNTCFELILSVSGPLCYDLCRQMSSSIALKMLARDELLPQAEKLGCSSQITLSYIPLNHGNVLSSLKHEAIATLDTSFVENTSDIQQCFVEGFSVDFHSLIAPAHFMRCFCCVTVLMQILLSTRNTHDPKLSLTTDLPRRSWILVFNV